MHLAGQADAVYCGKVIGRSSAQRGHRVPHSAPPVVRILLRPQRLRPRDGQRLGGFGEHMLATADLNKDGKVSTAEMQQMALQHFDKADVNHDGKLTPDERKQSRPAKRAQRKA